MTRTLLLLAGILACVAIISCTERPDDHFISFTGCDCQSGHWGREFQASMCSYGPEEEGYARRECLYQRGNSILTRPLEEYPL